MPGWWPPWHVEHDRARKAAECRADAALARLNALSDELRSSVERLEQIAERLGDDAGDDAR